MIQKKSSAGGVKLATSPYNLATLSLSNRNLETPSKNKPKHSTSIHGYSSELPPNTYSMGMHYLTHRLQNAIE